MPKKKQDSPDKDKARNDEKPDTKVYVVEAFIALLLLGSSVLFWWAISQSLTGALALLTGEEAAISTQSLLSVAAGYIALLVSLILVVLLVNDSRLRVGIYLLALLGLTVLPGNTAHLIFSVLLMLGVLLVFDYLLQKDISNHIFMSLPHIFSGKLRVLTIVFSVIIALQMFVVTGQNLDQFGFTLPQELIEKAFDTSLPFVQGFIEEQQQNLQEQFMRELESQIPFLKTMPEEDKAALLTGEITPRIRAVLKQQGYTDSQVDQLRQQIREQNPFVSTEKESGGEKGEDELTAENLQDLPMIQKAKQGIESSINSFIQENRGLLPWLFSISGFVFFSSLGILFHLAAVLVATAVLVLMEKGNIVVKKQIKVGAERYKISR